MMGFLARVKPDWILASTSRCTASTSPSSGRPSPAGSRASSACRRTTLDCGGVCHGTMTGWYNHRFGGFALTVEYGGSPPPA